jgi:hypothetical protein
VAIITRGVSVGILKDTVRHANPPAVKIDPTPTHAVHLIFPSVRMLARQNEAIADTRTKTAVHVPWDETAFNPIDVLRRPEQEQKIQSSMFRLEESIAARALYTHRCKPQFLGFRGLSARRAALPHHRWRILLGDSI